jgi:hypothetical protein
VIKACLACYRGEDTLSTATIELTCVIPRRTLEVILAVGSRILREEPTVVTTCVPPPTASGIRGRLVVVGDTHGTIEVLHSLFTQQGSPSSSARFVFNGDYVDRGSFSIEVYACLLALKIRDPDSVLMLRGNHESREVCSNYTFHGEVLQKYPAETASHDSVPQVVERVPAAQPNATAADFVFTGLSADLDTAPVAGTPHELFERFIASFQCLPLGCVVKDRGLAIVHGGLPGSSLMASMTDVANINRFREPDSVHNEAAIAYCTGVMVEDVPFDDDEYGAVRCSGRCCLCTDSDSEREEAEAAVAAIADADADADADTGRSRPSLDEYNEAIKLLKRFSKAQASDSACDVTAAEADAATIVRDRFEAQDLLVPDPEESDSSEELLPVAPTAPCGRCPCSCSPSGRSLRDVPLIGDPLMDVLWSDPAPATDLRDLLAGEGSGPLPQKVFNVHRGCACLFTPAAAKEFLKEGFSPIGAKKPIALQRLLRSHSCVEDGYEELGVVTTLFSVPRYMNDVHVAGYLVLQSGSSLPAPTPVAASIASEQRARAEREIASVRRALAAHFRTHGGAAAAQLADQIEAGMDVTGPDRSSIPIPVLPYLPRLICSAQSPGSPGSKGAPAGPVALLHCLCSSAHAALSTQPLMRDQAGGYLDEVNDDLDELDEGPIVLYSADGEAHVVPAEVQAKTLLDCLMRAGIDVDALISSTGPAAKLPSAHLLASVIDTALAESREALATPASGEEELFASESATTIVTELPSSDEFVREAAVVPAIRQVRDVAAAEDSPVPSPAGTKRRSSLSSGDLSAPAPKRPRF